jgi:hypothetical protein
MASPMNAFEGEIRCLPPHESGSERIPGSLLQEASIKLGMTVDGIYSPFRIPLMICVIIEICG